MKILICGSSGDIGQDLTKILSKKEYKIVAVSRSKNTSIKLKKKNVKYLNLDFSKDFKIHSKFDLVINCIATHEFSKNKQMDDYLNSNMFTMINILKNFSKNKVKILNLSTISIFDLSKFSVLKEDCSDVLNNNLSITKFLGEKILSLGNKQVINLRLPGVLTLSKKSLRPWLKNIIAKISNGKNIKLHNSNKKFNSIIDTYEIVRLIDYLLNNKFVPGTYNLSANKPITLNKLISKIKENFKSKTKIYNIGNNNSNVIISNKLIKEKLGFAPSSVTQIINRYLNA